MNWEPLLTGALAGGIVNVVWNYAAKRMDFRYDYKKYILKKRQVVYEDIETLLAELKSVRFYTQAGKVVYKVHGIFVANEAASHPFFNVNDRILSITNRSIWLSDAMYEKLLAMNFVLNTIDKDLLGYNPGPDTIKQAGIDNFAIIEKARIDILQQLFNDVKSLDSVDTFKRQKKKLF